MRFQKLTVPMPVFNEVGTIEDILRQVDTADTAGLERELIIVDDGCTDGTREALERLDGIKTPVRVLFHAQNGEGDGAANGAHVCHGRIRPDPGCGSGV